MKGINKKYLIAGLIGVVTLTGATLYLQYKRLMDYVISFKSIKIKKVSFTLFDFDLFLNFQNKSTLKFTIESQSYDVYINNIYVTKLENNSPVLINPKSTSVIGLNVKFNPKEVLEKLNKNIANLLVGTDKLMIKIDMKLKVKMWFFTINIPYVYEDSLKNMMSN